MSRYTLYIGSYATADEVGITHAIFDENTLACRIVQQHKGIINPTFLQIDPLLRRLYALTEMCGERQKEGGIATFAIAPTGDLTALHTVPTTPATTCHLTVNTVHRLAIVSSYHGGMIGVCRLGTEGDVLPPCTGYAHHRTSVLPVQQQSRLHSVTFDPQHRFALACDLGGDAVYTYHVGEEGTLCLAYTTPTAPRAGPRHVAFHPSLCCVYVIHELNATVSVYDYDGQSGKLFLRQTISTLPATYTHPNACAEIAVSADGRFVYGSNRGHDSVVVYAVRPDGTLDGVAHAPSGGEHPRHFALSPSGNSLLVCHRDSHTLVMHRRDPQTGALVEHSTSIAMQRPVYVCFGLPYDVEGA